MTAFIEEDYDYSESELDEEESIDPEIFHDPFFDIGPYLQQDPLLSDNPNLPELIFFLKSAWIDPYFYRNRTLCSLPTDDYLPEEKGLLILIQKLLNLAPDKPLDHHLLTVFCIITGRCSKLLKFDQINSSNIRTVHFKAPFQIYSNPGEGPCCISPYLIILAINETVTFPSIISILETHFLKNDTIEIESETTTDLYKSFNFAQREPPKLFHLSFDSGLTLTNKIQRFPTSDGGFWVRVTCEPFSIAYGWDITNGKGKVKFPWVNRFNGQQPPTLSETGHRCEVDWIDQPVFQKSVLDFYKDILVDPPNYCPLTSSDPVGSFKSIMKQLRPEVRDYDTIFVDPLTGRIKDEDMHYLLEDEKSKTLIIGECNEFCLCRGDCPCHITCQPSFGSLMLFYSPDKDWGVVATEDILPGTLIAIYAGEQKREDELIEDKDHVYYFALEFGDNDTKLSYHAWSKCNIGRFINQTHSSPVRSETPFSQPNATPRKISSPFVEMSVIGIFATRRIFKGEEITISYGEMYTMKRNCACNYCMSELSGYKAVLEYIEKSNDQVQPQDK